LVGLEEDVGWLLVPTVMAGHDRLPLKLMPGGRLILGRGGGPLLEIYQCRFRAKCQAHRGSTHGGWIPGGRLKLYASMLMLISGITMQT
jgi:hypothetical protein